MTDLDAVELEILRNQLESVAEEMGEVLIRGAYSPNITERRDCSTALFDAEGRLVAQAEHIPVHLGAMPDAVSAVLDRDPRSGDVFVLNDPFEGGTHLPDVTLVAPIASEPICTSAEAATSSGQESLGQESSDQGSSDQGSSGRGITDQSSADRKSTVDQHDGQQILGYAVSRAHHADVGGMAPGSMPAGATEIHQEGLRLPPVRIFSEGSIVEDAMSILLANVRAPAERRADLRAQLAATERGADRVRELLETHGDRLRAAFDAVIEYSRRRVEAELQDLPDGTYEATDVMEGDGVTDADVPIEVTVDIDGSSMTVDFTGTAPQVEGNINAPLSVARSAVYYVLRCLTDPDIPPNQGCYDPVTVTAPEGSLLNPAPPAAVVGGNVETSQRVTDVVFAALADAAPDRVPAGGQGTMNNLVVGTSTFAYYETIGGGAGARPDGDGLSGVQVGMTNTLNTPVETLEDAYPLAVETYAIRDGSGGDGRHRGGEGLIRELRTEVDATVSLLTERRRHAPRGLAGGEDGTPGVNLIEGAAVGAKTTRDVPAGTTVRIETPGGGGHGPPEDRET